MRKVAAAVLLSGRVGEIFESIVTGASDKGTYVRLLSPPAEGRVVRGESGMEVGEKVKVRLIRLQPELGYIDFEGVGPYPKAFFEPVRKQAQRFRRRGRR